ILDLIPGTGRPQIFEFLRFERILVEADDTHRGQALDDGVLTPRLRHSAGRPPGHPSAPCEADDHGGHDREDTPPEDGGLRRPGLTPRCPAPARGLAGCHVLLLGSSPRSIGADAVLELGEADRSEWAGIQDPPRLPDPRAPAPGPSPRPRSGCVPGGGRPLL